MLCFAGECYKLYRNTLSCAVMTQNASQIFSCLVLDLVPCTRKMRDFRRINKLLAHEQLWDCSKTKFCPNPWICLEHGSEAQELLISIVITSGFFCTGKLKLWCRSESRGSCFWIVGGVQYLCFFCICQWILFCYSLCGLTSLHSPVVSTKPSSSSLCNWVV